VLGVELQKLHAWEGLQQGERVEGRCRANVAHIRQSRPNSGPGFQTKVLKNIKVVPSSLGSGEGAMPAGGGVKAPFIGHVF